ncbi:uncharacterized protein MONOS_7485 [Monocercomonoides exilis]|uniref:uncharacterized protein n=1 Tax=Monocercomonoides exilis TaxID=2049356 RepID=UPI00355A3FB7|nr:hypothetical protein MONOS_7485 [Monocercomonoides exilis]|eukprot:MONOS_7485.1-p1 / transcript=MONOS_7485.1 / gene=MONOS_7485 / organism=Monocercomonoides_exilis_PA203 / gene_product=unspecified product / transcript_product=unspecified product / location=Mono_scaffold00256:67290-67705(+) / protein_length=103 / sequence_SO=supercontig / SO=protein_coding / is_pseudo=false
MYNLTPMTSATKGTTRENKGNLGTLRESRSGSAGGRRMAYTDEMCGAIESLSSLLISSSSSFSGAMNKKGYVFRLHPLGVQDPNKGGRGHEGQMPSKKEKLG